MAAEARCLGSSVEERFTERGPSAPRALCSHPTALTPPLPRSPARRECSSASSDNASRKKKAAPQAAANSEHPDELVLVPHSLWTDYACDEFAGKGWLARIITRKRGWARVEFLHARDKEGNKYSKQSTKRKWQQSNSI